MFKLYSAAAAIVLFTPLALFAAAKPTVVLYRAGERQLDDVAKAKLVDWSIEFVKSANFNTANQAAALRAYIVATQESYRATLREDCLIVSFDRPMAIKALSGDVNAVEIVAGLNHFNGFASSLLTVDPQGRVVRHEKYGGLLPPELAPNAASRERQLQLMKLMDSYRKSVPPAKDIGEMNGPTLPGGNGQLYTMSNLHSVAIRLDVKS